VGQPFSVESFGNSGVGSHPNFHAVLDLGAQLLGLLVGKLVGALGWTDTTAWTVAIMT
jgi:hypothetical protein